MPTKALLERVSRFPLLLISIMSAMTALPVVFSPLTADDIPNSKLRSNLLTLQGDLLQNSLSSIWNATNQWLEVEGRFFPGAVIYGHIVHFIFQGQGLYKLFLALICFGIASQIFYFINYRFSQKTALLGVVFFLSTYSIRYVYFHDGVTSFAGMVPFALFLYLAALNLALRTSKVLSWRLLSAIFLYVFASLIYEHFAILFLGTFLFLFLLGTTPRLIMYIFFSLSLLQILFAIILKVGTSTAPAYSLSFSPLSVIKTTYIQFVGGFPGSQYWGSNHFISESLLYWVQKSFPLIIILAIISWILLQKILSTFDIDVVDKKHAFPYIIFGLSLAFIPAFLTGVTLQWQSGLPMGEAYLCVTIQGAGLGILAAVCFDWLSRVYSNIAKVLFLCILAFFYLNVVWNFLFIQQ